MFWDVDFHCNFANRAKCLCRFFQNSPRKYGFASPYSAAAFRLVKVLFIRSFIMLLARKTSTRRGVIGTSSPVFGFLPTRWPLDLMPKDPNEDSLTGSPRSRLEEISFRTNSTRSADSFRGKPTLWTTASARSALVSVLPTMIPPPSSRDDYSDANRQIGVRSMVKTKKFVFSQVVSICVGLRHKIGDCLFLDLIAICIMTIWSINCGGKFCGWCAGVEPSPTQEHSTPCEPTAHGFKKDQIGWF